MPLGHVAGAVAPGPTLEPTQALPAGQVAQARLMTEPLRSGAYVPLPHAMTTLLACDGQA